MSLRIVCSVRSAAFLSTRLFTTHKMGKIDTPHLTKGDVQPPLQKGLLRLYSMRFCPYAQRAILVLDAKNVPYDTVNANLTVKPDWLFNKSEGGKVPVIEFENGQVMAESLIIADYLDNAYPDPPLYPADPLSKAKDKLLIDKLGAVTLSFYQIIATKDGFTSENFEQLVKLLEEYESELSHRATAFFGGENPGMVDFMMWPFMERSPLLAVKGGAPYELPQDRLPKLLEWMTAMFANSVVAQSALPVAVHRLYLDNRKIGVYDFDFSAHL